MVRRGRERVVFLLSPFSLYCSYILIDFYWFILLFVWYLIYSFLFIPSLFCALQPSFLYFFFLLFSPFFLSIILFIVPYPFYSSFCMPLLHHFLSLFLSLTLSSFVFFHWLLFVIFLSLSHSFFPSFFLVFT